MIVFILVNLVLMLNLVIAILSSTFAKYEVIKMGLYNNVLAELFPIMQWDDHYGALVCAKPPFNLLAIPFVPFYFVITDKEKLFKFNNLLCHLMYIPISLVLMVCFNLMNLCMIPIAYCYHLSRLFALIFTHNTLSSVLSALKNFLKFWVIGLFILILSIPLNSVKFFRSLYTDIQNK